LTTVWVDEPGSIYMTRQTWSQGHSLQGQGLDVQGKTKDLASRDKDLASKAKELTSKAKIKDWSYKNERCQSTAAEQHFLPNQHKNKAHRAKRIDIKGFSSADKDLTSEAKTKDTTLEA